MVGISSLKDIYKSFVTNIVDVPARLLSLLIFLLLLVFPVAKPDLYVLRILIIANIYAVLGASWDLLVGRTGQISLGHALFFGIGAYTTALLGTFFNLPPWLTMPVGILAAVPVALFIGYPCLRVKGPYLALVTMAFPLITMSLLFVFKDITRGEEGVAAQLFFPGMGLYETKTAEFYLTFLLLLVAGVTLYKIANSKLGIIFVSILDDELASKACGINVTKYKMLSFAISGVFGSLAGTTYAHFLGVAGPSTLSLTISFLPIILTTLGGIGTIYGPIAAAFILQIVDSYVLAVPDLTVGGIQFLPVTESWRPLIFIAVVIILILKWPRGIARFVTDKLEDLKEEREIEERGKRIWKRYKKKKRSSTHGE